jgi:SAM-dependent methyltransferase
MLATSPALEELLALHRLPFPTRVPEPDEPMTPAENAAFAAWQATPIGRAIYAGLAAHILERVGLRDGQRALFVAEGQGALARALAERRPAVEALATDISEDFLARARQAPRPANLRHALASAYDLSRVGPADLVVCAFSFHHLHDPAAGLRSMWRAVAPGGALYVVDLRRDIDPASYLANLEEQALADPSMARLSAQSVHAAHTTDELRELLRAAAPEARVEVGRVALGPAASEAVLGDAPWELPPIEAVRARIDGMWVEGLARR